jgi:hypothetical protein
MRSCWLDARIWNAFLEHFHAIQIIWYTWDMLVIPNTKHIASRMLDLPEPFRPVMALKEGSHPTIWVRTGYDLKPVNRYIRNEA